MKNFNYLEVNTLISEVFEKYDKECMSEESFRLLNQVKNELHQKMMNYQYNDRIIGEEDE